VLAVGCRRVIERLFGNDQGCDESDRSLQWRQLRPLLDADADRADLELPLIKLLLKVRMPVYPFAGNGGSWRKAAVHTQ
jgi:hypothetical protein